MNSKLKDILETKQKEIEMLLKDKDVLESILASKKKNEHLFREALKVAGMSVIAEIKTRAAPQGQLAKIEEPQALARKYSKAGAAAICVVTDQEYLYGHLNDLKKVAKVLDSLHPCPVLRKDFIIDPLQIAESKLAGASAIILIVELLQEKLKTLLELTHFIGLDALVEVHNEHELQIAQDAGAQIIGVSAQKLGDLKEESSVLEKLISKIPKRIVKIAGPKISHIDQVHQMHQLGYDGVLIDEMLAQVNDPREIFSEIGNG